MGEARKGDAVTAAELASHPATGPWIRNSLKARIEQFDLAAHRLLNSHYSSEAMKHASEFVAAAYTRAANELRGTLSQVDET